MNILSTFRKHSEEKRRMERETFLKHWYRDAYFLIAVTPCFNEAPYRKITTGSSFILARGDEELYRVFPNKKEAWPMIAEEDLFFNDQKELYKLLKVAYNTNKSLWNISFEDFPIYIQSSRTRRAYLVYREDKYDDRCMAVPVWFDSDITTAEELESLEENVLLYDIDDGEGTLERITL